MLVLSRKEGQGFHFPSLGISVQVLGASGVVKVGIEAPRHLEVFRGELGVPPSAPPALRAGEYHAQANLLNKLTLELSLAERYLASGRVAEAQAHIEHALGRIDDLSQKKEREAGSAPSVLIVEDDTNERELMAGLLSLDGWTVHSVPNGEAALTHLERSELPDLIVLDMMMPVCDGATTVRRLRASPRARHIPVVVMSGSSPESNGLGLGPDGPDAWYEKPIRPRQVLPQLRGWLRPAAS